MGEYFPFIHFVSAVVIPFTYWVACIELGVYETNENQFTLTFGQVSVLLPRARSNHSIRINVRSSRLSWPSRRSSKSASSRPVYSTGSITLHGSGESMVTVPNHEIPLWMKLV